VLLHYIDSGNAIKNILVMLSRIY